MIRLATNSDFCSVQHPRNLNCARLAGVKRNPPTPELRTLPHCFLVQNRTTRRTSAPWRLCCWQWGGLGNSDALRYSVVSTVLENHWRKWAGYHHLSSCTMKQCNFPYLYFSKTCSCLQAMGFVIPCMNKYGTGEEDWESLLLILFVMFWKSYEFRFWMSETDSFPYILDSICLECLTSPKSVSNHSVSNLVWCSRPKPIFAAQGVAGLPWPPHGVIACHNNNGDVLCWYHVYCWEFLHCFHEFMSSCPMRLYPKSTKALQSFCVYPNWMGRVVSN